MREIVSEEEAKNRLQAGIWEKCTVCHSNGVTKDSHTYWTLDNGKRYYGSIGQSAFNPSNDRTRMAKEGSYFTRLP